MNKEIVLHCEGVLFVGNGHIKEKCSIVISDGLIRRVVDGLVKPSENSLLLSFPASCTLLPGFIDCHTHIALDGTADPFGNSLRDSLPVKVLKAARNAENTLRAGVTTIRDMGGADSVDLEIMRAAASGLVKGPRILASGRAICITGGHGWPIGREADGPWEVAKAVREQIKAGAALVKFMVTGGALTPGCDAGASQMTREELEAGIFEAHKAGRKTAAHAKGAEGILCALKAGIDSIEHGTVLTEEAVAWMSEHSVPLILTLSALHNMERVGVTGGVPAFALEKALLYKPRRQESIRMAQKAGLPIGMGTDAGTPFNRHGENLQELELLTRAGYSPEAALMAATSSAARILGLEKEIGTVEEGKLADLVVVEGNPVQDIARLSDRNCIRTVIKAGEVIIDRR